MCVEGMSGVKPAEQKQATPNETFFIHIACIMFQKETQGGLLMFQ